MFETILGSRVILFIFLGCAASTNAANSGSTTEQCQPSLTTVNGVAGSCSGQIIFTDDFTGDSLDMSKWSMERRLPQNPDYEFNMYLQDVDGVWQMDSGKLVIKPVATNRHFDREVLRRTFSLGPSCTGQWETEECVFHPRTANKLNPLITAQLKTKDKFSFKYGRVEIRAKLPGAMWVYPQLWLEPNKPLYGTLNYESGQMRVAHTIVNGDDIILNGGLVLNSHEPWRTLKMCQHPNITQSMVQEFHIYELIWQPNAITVAMDGQTYCRIEIENDEDAFKNVQILGEHLPNRELLNDGNNWAPFDQEFAVTLGYGVGGSNDFMDSENWTLAKPWRNKHPRSKNLFWKEYSNNTNWLKNGDLIIDYVKVYAI